MWNRGINSDAVLRANRAAGGGPLLGGVGPTTAGVNLNSSLLRGGRGGSSIDRGRGRNLRGSSFHYPPHRTNYDEYSDLMPSFVRSSRPFERTQVSHSFLAIVSKGQYSPESLLKLSLQDWSIKY